MKNSEIAKNKDKILVIGHKNPDSDSIVAAVAYAHLLQKSGVDAYAGSAGLASKRSAFLFDKFEMQLPEVVNNVYRRVQDIMNHQPLVMKDKQALLDVAIQLQRNHRSRVPVEDNNGRFVGMVSSFDLIERLFVDMETVADSADSEGIVGREVRTNIDMIADVLDAKKLYVHDGEQMECFHVYVGAMSYEKLRERLQNYPARLALVVGDRANIHELVLQLDISLMVVTGNSHVEDGVIERAKKQGISILKTHYDSGTTVRRMKLSSPLRLMGQNNELTFLPEDRLKDIHSLVMSNAEDIFPVLNDDGKLIGTFTKQDLEAESGLKLVLVDHNELEQAVDGAGEVPIVEIIDHHRLGMLITDKPITVRNYVVGSTCTIVTELYRERGVTPSHGMAGILMGGIIADTLTLRSPTATDRDRLALEWLQQICKVEPRKLEEEVIKVGSLIATMSAQDVLLSDQKKYMIGRYNILISQVEEVGFNNFEKHRISLLLALQNMQKRDNLDLCCLLVTDVVKETSMLLAVGTRHLLNCVPYRNIRENLFDLPNVLSRKKQVLPQLIKSISSYNRGY